MIKSLYRERSLRRDAECVRNVMLKTYCFAINYENFGVLNSPTYVEFALNATEIADRLTGWRKLTHAQNELLQKVE